MCLSQFKNFSFCRSRAVPTCYCCASRKVSGKQQFFFVDAISIATHRTGGADEWLDERALLFVSFELMFRLNSLDDEVKKRQLCKQLELLFID
jgi:hypothetical protein